MDGVAYFKRQYVYNHWANHESAAGVLAIHGDASRAVRILNHIAGAERLWLQRLHGDPPSVQVWPDAPAGSIPGHLDAIHAAWTLFLENQREEKLLRPISYKNSRGEPWASRVEEILMHVIVHSAYHRGQLAILIRDAGADPPMTDFIHAVRTGVVD
jgi:uncharacterized damage-inducible protein DinB